MRKQCITIKYSTSYGSNEIICHPSKVMLKICHEAHNTYYVSFDGSFWEQLVYSEFNEIRSIVEFNAN